eukprot:TRINITY_DN23589_c0_g1_i1.p1 TRINITY_DN23589_c0_g1~~TRINITY_DN23589_c0_g1_i1.p1  ORF type:complete len:470 (+),score=43.35 TRINITY_DN23589_c0_g1_i1:91-1410(+)
MQQSTGNLHNKLQRLQDLYDQIQSSAEKLCPTILPNLVKSEINRQNQQLSKQINSEANRCQICGTVSQQLVQDLDCGINFFEQLIQVQSVCFLCDKCSKLRNLHEVMQLLVAYSIQDCKDVDELVQHLVVVNDLPDSITGSSAFRMEWMQEIYSLAYKLHVVTNGISGWKVEYSQELNKQIPQKLKNNKQSLSTNIHSQKILSESTHQNYKTKKQQLCPQELPEILSDDGESSEEEETNEEAAQLDLSSKYSNKTTKNKQFQQKKQKLLVNQFSEEFIDVENSNSDELDADQSDVSEEELEADDVHLINQKQNNQSIINKKGQQLQLEKAKLSDKIINKFDSFQTDGQNQNVSSEEEDESEEENISLDDVEKQFHKMNSTRQNIVANKQRRLKKSKMEKSGIQVTRERRLTLNRKKMKILKKRPGIVNKKYLQKIIKQK